MATGTMDMDDAFVKSYFEIDLSGKGQITRAELERYAEKNEYDEKFIATWLKLFDRKDTGIIVLQELCDVLGLELEEVKEKYSCLLPNSVEVLSADMTSQLRKQIYGICVEGKENNDEMKDVAKWIKGTLDERLGRLWHCVIVQGQYWSYYSHEPGYSFVFRWGRYVWIVWRTPEL